MTVIKHLFAFRSGTPGDWCAHCDARWSEHPNAPELLTGMNIQPHEFTPALNASGADECGNCYMTRRADVHDHGRRKLWHDGQQRVAAIGLATRHCQLVASRLAQLIDVEIAQVNMCICGDSRYWHDQSILSENGECSYPVCTCPRFTPAATISIDAEECTHPNGFGPYGCAGCGTFAGEADDKPLEPHQFVPPGGSPEAATYCAREDCDAHWTNSIHDPAKWAEVAITGADVDDEIQALADAMAADAEVESGLLKLGRMEEALRHLKLEKLSNADAEAEFRHNDLAEQLASWWHARAQNEIDRTVPKAAEYGSTDLRDIGRDLADCMGRDVTNEEATELGIFFYLRGKLSRWVDAIKRGDRVSDDTIFDIGVYCRMAQRNRDVGGWPGTRQE